MTEQLLNLTWLSIAIFAFAVVLPLVKRRRLLAAVALAGTVALLFPIISISDDLNADSAAQEVLVVLLTVAALIVVLGAVARLAFIARPPLPVAILESSDPRSPPRR